MKWTHLPEFNYGPWHIMVGVDITDNQAEIMSVEYRPKPKYFVPLAEWEQFKDEIIKIAHKQVESEELVQSQIEKDNDNVSDIIDASEKEENIDDILDLAGVPADERVYIKSIEDDEHNEDDDGKIPDCADIDSLFEIEEENDSDIDKVIEVTNKEKEFTVIKTTKIDSDIKEEILNFYPHIYIREYKLKDGLTEFNARIAQKSSISTTEDPFNESVFVYFSGIGDTFDKAIASLKSKIKKWIKEDKERRFC